MACPLRGRQPACPPLRVAVGAASPSRPAHGCPPARHISGPTFANSESRRKMLK